MNRTNHQPQSVSGAISLLASDNKSGAAEILRQAGAVFKKLNAELQRSDPRQAQHAILETCAALASAQPDMTPLLRLANAAVAAARTTSNARDSLNRAEEAAERFIENAISGARAASVRAAGLIKDGGRVLTHSRSSTVLAALVEARRAGRNLSVVATESRPMLEGRALAAELAAVGIPAISIADAAAALALDEVDLVIMGADKITPGTLVNKIGTRMIALAARERGLPLYAVCDSSKFICEEFLSGTARRHENGAELWPDAPQGVIVLNSYFESTRLELFSGIVTEDAVLSIPEAYERADQATIDTALVCALEVEIEGIK